MLATTTNNISDRNDASGAGNARAATLAAEKKRLLQLVKHLFTEVLDELLQNSLRAGAKNVIVTTTEDTLTISDDGTGLSGEGADKFSSLMKIAESSYERGSIKVRDPIGVGLISLFALEGVSQVVVSSNGYSLAIDINRLWNEEGYRQSWESRVRHTASQPEKGLKLEITFQHIATNERH